MEFAAKGCIVYARYFFSASLKIVNCLTWLVSARNIASIEDLKASGINSIQLDVNNTNSIKVAVDKYEFLFCCL